MKVHAAAADQTSATLGGVAVESVQSALARMHTNDRMKVSSGVVKASSLHLIRAADARTAKVHWTAATTVRFKG